MNVFVDQYWFWIKRYDNILLPLTFVIINEKYYLHNDGGLNWYRINSATPGLEPDALDHSDTNRIITQN